MTETPSRRGRAINIIIISLIVLLAPPLVYFTLTFFVGEPPQLYRRAIPTFPPAGADEVLRIPFGVAATYQTEKQYQGEVQLVIGGNGTLDGETLSDAFYTYTGPDGFGLTEPQPLTLRVNGELVSPPVFNLFHIYEITVSLGETPDVIRITPPAGPNPAADVTLDVYIVAGDGA
jgi:hypothetical protein